LPFEPETLESQSQALKDSRFQPSLH